MAEILGRQNMRIAVVGVVAVLACVPIQSRETSAQSWRGEIEAMMQAERASISQHQADLRELRSQLAATRVQRNLARRNFSDASAALHRLEDETAALEREKESIVRDLRLAVESPELVSPSQLVDLQQRNVQVRRRLVDREIARDNQLQSVREMETEYRTIEQEISDTRFEEKATEDRIRYLASKMTVIVEANGRCLLTQEMSPKRCEQFAVEQAEQRAAEIGGQSLIQSVTEVVNFQVIRDEIVRHIQALLIRKEFSIVFNRNSGDFGRYEVALIAAVQSFPQELPPAVPRTERTEIRASTPTEPVRRKTYSDAVAEWERTVTVSQWVAIGGGVVWAVLGNQWLQNRRDIEDLKDDRDNAADGAEENEAQAKLDDKVSENNSLGRTIVPVAILTLAAAGVWLVSNANPPDPADYVLSLQPIWTVGAPHAAISLVVKW